MIYRPERRKDQRALCLVPIESKPGTLFEGIKTVDISLGGMGFVSKKKLPLHQKMAIEIELTPQERPILVLGKVRWLTPFSQARLYRIGLQFEGVLQYPSRLRLNKYMKSREK